MSTQIRSLQRLIVFLALTTISTSGLKSTTYKPKPVTLANRIVIVKSRHTMTLMHDDHVLKTYQVALGTVPIGAKREQGDHKTPEGDYTISAKNAHSEFHLSLRISYPNAIDRQRAYRLGVSPGGEIMIHGLMARFAYLGSLHRQTDWTDGCIAVTNPEIEEIWNLVPVGTKVTIKP